MSYAQHALAEADFRNRRARHIVYGHTHQHEIVPLDASHADGYVLNQTYFNAGTWRRCYQPTQTLAGNHELVACDSFSLLAFYQGDERSGRTLRNVVRHARAGADGHSCPSSRLPPRRGSDHGFHSCAAIRQQWPGSDGARVLELGEPTAPPGSSLVLAEVNNARLAMTTMRMVCGSPGLSWGISLWP